MLTTRLSGVDPATEKITQPKCNGEQGSYQIGLKNAPSTYYVQKDGTGSFVATTGNPFRWDNIPAGAHTVKIRAEQNNPNCEATRTFNIANPVAITVSVPNNVLIGCNPSRVEVTVTANGGSAPYSYELYRGATRITGSNNPKFVITQAGTYRVVVKDTNNCTKDATFNVVSPNTISLRGTSGTANDFCTATTSQAKVEVEVTVAGGGNNAPYTFQLNGVTKATQNGTKYTFTGLGVGNHTFTVIDKYGCTTILLSSMSGSAFAYTVSFI